MGEAVMTSEGGDHSQSLKKFLPEMVLRVLLVEADDCTRQIIAALLRKCSYRVAAVSDGLKAWETLKERHHNIDLVLTEVDLPSISGYALLSLIVEHDMCKNIPVIMMSSTDSISTVLKCMVKGASDFLIKPVRKNELRNLWQHAWRKKIGQQNAGSRRPQNNVLENQKHDISENDAESNYSSDNLASIQGGNDKASDAQVVTGSSCRDDSNMLNDETHEECVEMVERSFMPKSKQLENVTSSGMGTSSGARPYSSADISSEEGRLFAEPRPMSTEVQQELRGKNTCTVEEVDFQLNELYSAPCTEAFDLIGKFESSLGDYASHSYDSKDKSNVASRLELSMRTFNPSCPNGEGSIEQNMLSNSKASAFSKYENKKTLQPLYSDWTSNFAALKDGPSSSNWEHDAPLTESQQNATALVMCQPGNHEAAVSGTQLNFNPVDMLSFGSTVANHTHLHPSMSHTESDCDQVQTPKSQSPLPTSSLTYSSSEVHIPEHRMQPFDDTTINSEDNVAEADNGKLITVEKARYDSATCGSSDFGSGVTNKLSSSRSGSNSNEATESSFSVASPGRAPVSESVNYNDKTKGESHSTSQREAALAKFRLKRKDRCFEKKVRYQSRKRLAEQRPRVKGQFVRQLQNETQPTMDNDKT